MSRHPHRRIVTMQVPIAGTLIVEYQVDDDQQSIEHDTALPVAEDCVGRISSIVTKGYNQDVYSVDLDSVWVDGQDSIKILKVDSP